MTEDEVDVKDRSKMLEQEMKEMTRGNAARDDGEITGSGRSVNNTSQNLE